MKTKFKSLFTNSTLTVSYFGAEGLCITIKSWHEGQYVTLDHVFTLNKGVKKLIIAIGLLSGK